MKPSYNEYAIKKMMLNCGKVAELNPDGVTYTCLHCKGVVGSKDEPPDCKTKREKAEPLQGDWWMFADEDLNDNSSK
jgi:hypothetical protein